jgi:hypothetical protein
MYHFTFRILYLLTYFIDKYCWNLSNILLKDDPVRLETYQSDVYS